MGAAEDAPIEIRRADFLALAWAVLGVFYFAVATFSLVSGDPFDVPNVLNVVVSLLWLAMAGYMHYKPDQMDDGTDPAPRTWFEVAGLVITLGVLTIIVGVLLAELNSPLF